MSRAIVRLYSELNDFLPPERRQRDFVYHLNGPVSVKHVIEALGVPHVEAEVILANGEAVDFGHPVQSDDRIAVYPVFSELDINHLTILRPKLGGPFRFIIDNHLGKLAHYLRLLGFDALYRNDYGDEELAHLSGESGRVLLTRDRRLLMRKSVVYGYCVRTRDPHQQLRDVIRRFKLWGWMNPWSRCLRCNGVLEPVPKAEVMNRLEPKTRLYYNDFHICPECRQIYWQGSHFRPMQQFIDQVAIQPVP